MVSIWLYLFAASGLALQSQTLQPIVLCQKNYFKAAWILTWSSDWESWENGLNLRDWQHNFNPQLGWRTTLGVLQKSAPLLGGLDWHMDEQWVSCTGLNWIGLQPQCLSSFLRLLIVPASSHPSTSSYEHLSSRWTKVQLFHPKGKHITDITTWLNHLRELLRMTLH